MKIIHYILLLIVSVSIYGMTKNDEKSKIVIKSEYKKYYDEYKVEGSFLLYDPQNDKFIVYNQEQTKQLFTPASTFKICNSLIGLETGVITDENFVIKWDSVVRQNVSWNRDFDLKDAYKNSTVWYYQELARRVAGEKMKYWLDKANYGNTDTTGGIDQFWLTGGLRITAEQQISFLQKLHDNQLPFSQRSMDIVKKIMIDETKSNEKCMLRAKTGWGSEKDKDIGWYVGYVEKNNKVYYFANCIQTADFSNNEFSTARKEITYKILKKLKIM